MTEIIKWCNQNEGFVSAILSSLGLLISVISIYVSIRTARLPYKKKIKLSASMDIRFSKGGIAEKSESSILGISVEAVNVGMRTVNIDYLGILVKDSSLSAGEQKMVKIRDDVTGEGSIQPGECKSELYQKVDLLYALGKLTPKAKVYLFATDTEGRKYIKKFGFASEMRTSLQR